MDIEQIRSTAAQFQGYTEDFPFDNVTLALRVGNKIFALVALDETPIRINLKCHPERSPELRAAYPHAILPGFHQNKLHWNTLVLDGSLPPALVRELLEISYTLVRSSLTKKQRAEAGL